jgi:hypothetical protein
LQSGEAGRRVRVAEAAVVQLTLRLRALKAIGGGGWLGDEHNEEDPDVGSLAVRLACALSAARSDLRVANSAEQ